MDPVENRRGTRASGTFKPDRTALWKRCVDEEAGHRRRCGFALGRPSTDLDVSRTKISEHRLEFLDSGSVRQHKCRGILHIPEVVRYNKPTRRVNNFSVSIQKEQFKSTHVKPFGSRRVRIQT